MMQMLSGGDDVGGYRSDSRCGVLDPPWRRVDVSQGRLGVGLMSMLR
jgi:hypothetical protein